MHEHLQHERDAVDKVVVPWKPQWKHSKLQTGPATRAASLEAAQEEAQRLKLAQQ